MSKKYYGSLCFTDILEQAKKMDKAFSKHENGKIYFKIDVWINDKKDKYDNDGSVLINSVKGEDTKKYIGNLKESKPKETPISESDISKFDDDIPF